MFRFVLPSIAGISFMLAISCGDSEVQYVQDFKYDVAENQVSLEVEFNRDLSLNTDFIVPIMQYGYVSLFSSDENHGVRLKTTLNMDALIDPEIISLERTRKLPNGQPMTTYVQDDVGRLHIKASDEVSTSVYFGLDPKRFYLGNAIEISFIDEQFPQGLVLSQRIRDQKGRMLGVVTFYGPKVEDGQVVAPGGFYFITNVSDLVEYIREEIEKGKKGQENGSGQPLLAAFEANRKLSPASETLSNNKAYQDKSKQLELFQLYQRKGKKAGLVD